MLKTGSEWINQALCEDRRHPDDCITIITIIGWKANTVMCVVDTPDLMLTVRIPSIVDSTEILFIVDTNL